MAKVMDAWVEQSLDAEAIAMAKDHGEQDAIDGFTSHVYDGALDYIRAAYEEGHRIGRAHLRQIRAEIADAADPDGFDGVPDLATLAKMYGIDTDADPEEKWSGIPAMDHIEDDGDDEGKVAA